MDVLEPSTRLIDTGGVTDTFVSGLGEVEDLGGGCFRFVFFTRQKVGGRDELIVVARLVAPMEAVPPAVFMAMKAIGLSFVSEVPPWVKVH
jgi:hypothetical protein